VPDHFYVYPSYLRRKAPRSLGRRLPVALATGEVSAVEIAAAAQRLGYRAEAEPAKQYPRQAHLFEGRVKVTKKAGVSKTQLLRQLAEALRATPEPPEGT
jgi:signal recognition particle subunit SEC65